MRMLSHTGSISMVSCQHESSNNFLVQNSMKILSHNVCIDMVSLPNVSSNDFTWDEFPYICWNDTDFCKCFKMRFRVNTTENEKLLHTMLHWYYFWPICACQCFLDRNYWKITSQIYCKNVKIRSAIQNFFNITTVALLHLLNS